MTKTASIVPNELAIDRHIPNSGGCEWIYFRISGWDDVEPYTRKVLEFDGRKFTFSCWNSDENYMVFRRPLTGVLTAKIARA